MSKKRRVYEISEIFEKSVICADRVLETVGRAFKGFQTFGGTSVFSEAKSICFIIGVEIIKVKICWLCKELDFSVLTSSFQDSILCV